MQLTRCFSSLLTIVDCLSEQAEPLLLRRVIMNTIPRFGTRNADGSSSSSDSNTNNSDAAEGCCPYIQVFKGGRLVFTTTYVPSHDTRHIPHAITATAGTDTTASTVTAASADAPAVNEADRQGSSASAAGDSSSDSTVPAVAAADTDSATAAADNTTAADSSTAAAADSSSNSSSSAAHTAAEPPATTTTATAATAATPTAAAAATTAAAALPWAYTSDESIAFSVDCVVQGDLLLRCRHLGPNGQRVSMFRAAFHTGYVPCGVLRLSKAQLDGACGDPRFDEVTDSPFRLEQFGGLLLFCALRWCSSTGCVCVKL
jgi:C2 domain of PTEN tumour-suppressor protein